MVADRPWMENALPPNNPEMWDQEPVAQEPMAVHERLVTELARRGKVPMTDSSVQLLLSCGRRLAVRATVHREQCLAPEDSPLEAPLTDAEVRFEECDGPEPTVREMVLSYYQQHMGRTHAALEYAARYMAVLEARNGR